jgi:hypothetical protein
MTWMGILFTELKQNLKLSLNLSFVSLLLGISISLGFQANHKINELVRPVHWGAEMAIIPKGFTLNQLAENLRKGEAPVLLPEAMFDTTVDMTKGILRMSAVLPGVGASGTYLMVRGESILDLSWTGLPVQPWIPQTLYSTSDWGTKVIAAAFASGSHENLARLKDLVDRKTVGQAFWIDDVQKAELEQQRELSHLASGIEAIIVVSLLLSIFLAASWLRANHLSTQVCLTDIGYTRFELRKLQALMILILLVLPLLIGFILVPANLI